MKFHVQFQELPLGADRPIDYPTASDFSVDETTKFAFIPSPGDFVHVVSLDGASASYEGKVRSRLFNYFGADNCVINIVVETGGDDDYGKLIKE